MGEFVEWDALYAEYAAVRSAARCGNKGAKSFEFPRSAVRRIVAPMSEDIRWLTEALGHDERKWFVADLARRSESLAEVLFTPMLLPLPPLRQLPAGATKLAR